MGESKKDKNHGYNLASSAEALLFIYPCLPSQLEDYFLIVLNLFDHLTCFDQ
jgi:hypothetical protein